MRTTVTLDPDDERLIGVAMKERSISFKQALNDAARIGLSGKAQGRGKILPEDFSHGRCAGIPLGQGTAAADAIEDEELSRKLILRK